MERTWFKAGRGLVHNICARKKIPLEVLGLQNQLVELEQESVYFRGCYDSVGYLKKAGIL